MREQWFAGNGFLGECVFSIFHYTVGDAHTHLKDLGLRGALPNVLDELRLGRVVYSRALAGRSSIRVRRQSRIPAVLVRPKELHRRGVKPCHDVWTDGG